MPLEIRELQIKVTVDQPQGGGAAPQQDGAASPPKNGDDKEALINQCIDQVMEILNNRKER